MRLRFRDLCVLSGLGLALGCVSGVDDSGGGNGNPGSAGTNAPIGPGTGGATDGNGGRSNGNGGNMTGGNATGGNVTGGNMTGGNATGGNATGGSATGGNATGGNATGGNATGGNATGGNATGGNAAGGKATGGSAAGGSSASDPYGDARTRCVNRTNELRATKGLGPIPILAKAEPCADGQAKADSISGKAHSAFNACLDQVKWTGAGQNECPNYGSVQDTLTKCLDAMWAEGPGGGHYDNMVGNSTHTACGFYTTAAGKVWMVQDFWTE
jgi:hypothetical protein